MRLARLTLIPVLTASLLIAVAGSAWAAPRLDAGFGKQGVARAPIALHGSEALGSALEPVVQANGRVLVAAPLFGSERPDPTQVALARFRRDGSRDRSFGRGGSVRVGFRRHFGLRSLHVLPDGRLLLVGWTSPADGLGIQPSQLGLVRLLPNGARDPSFGTRGFVAWNPPRHVSDALMDVVPVFADLRADGELIVASSVRESSLPGGESWNRLTFARFGEDGTVSGITERDWDGETFVDAAELPGDRFTAVLLDTRLPAPGSARWSLWRFDPDPAGGFAPSAPLPLAGAMLEDLFGLAPAPDGSLLMFGDVGRDAAAGPRGAVRRAAPDGTLDPAYGQACERRLPAVAYGGVATPGGALATVTGTARTARARRTDSWLLSLGPDGCPAGRALRLKGLSAGTPLLRPRRRALVAASGGHGLALVRVRR